MPLCNLLNPRASLRGLLPKDTNGSRRWHSHCRLRDIRASRYTFCEEGMTLKQDPAALKLKLGRKYVAKRSLPTFLSLSGSPPPRFLVVALVPLCMVLSYFLGVNFLFSKTLPSHLRRQYRKELLGFRSTHTPSAKTGRNTSFSALSSARPVTSGAFSTSASPRSSVSSSPSASVSPGVRSENAATEEKPPHPLLEPSSDADARQRSGATRSAGSMTESKDTPQKASLPPKLAFLFLTRGLLPLTPLWERFFKVSIANGKTVCIVARTETLCEEESPFCCLVSTSVTTVSARTGHCSPVRNSMHSCRAVPRCSVQASTALAGAALCRDTMASSPCMSCPRA